MRKVLLFALLLGLVYSACNEGTLISDTSPDLQSSDYIQAESTPVSEVIQGHYIVVFNDDVLPGSRSTVNKENYATRQNDVKSFALSLFNDRDSKIEKIHQTYAKTMLGVAMELEEDEVEMLRKDRRVNFIEQDQTMHATMGGPPGGGGDPPPQTTPWGVARVGGAIDGTNAGKAWILDSGIDLDHPDLNVDVANSVSFLTGGGGSTSPDDQNGHGTHVAGTVGAIDNSEGVIGVAAGATVVAVRVLDRRGSGSNSGVIAGVDYVAANASSGDAANMSLGGGVSAALDAAVLAASSTCPFALAAGNSSTDANNSSPARVNGPNIYTVSSMSQGDNWSSFSNYGNPPVDYCAPGSSVYSTYKGAGYATLSGTSMASPHVCGILLIGGISSDGTVNGDPDGNNDDIAHH